MMSPARRPLRYPPVIGLPPSGGKFVMTIPNSPGWYDDPDSSDALRFFDGQDWTPQRRRKSHSTSSQPLGPNRPDPCPPSGSADPYAPTVARDVYAAGPYERFPTMLPDDLYGRRVPPIYPAGPYAPPADPYGSMSPAYSANPSPGYTPNYAAPQPPQLQTNQLAIWSLVASIAGLIIWIFAIPGTIMGILALDQVNKSGERGRGMAISGIAVGGVGLLFGVIITSLWLV